MAKPKKKAKSKHVGAPQRELSDPNVVLPRDVARSVARGEILQQYIYGPRSGAEVFDEITHNINQEFEKLRLLVYAIQQMYPRKRP